MTFSTIRNQMRKYVGIFKEKIRVITSSIMNCLNNSKLIFKINKVFLKCMFKFYVGIYFELNSIKVEKKNLL